MDPHVIIPRHGDSFSLMDGLPELDSTNCHQGQPLEAITTLHVIRGEVFYKQTSIATSRGQTLRRGFYIDDVIGLLGSLVVGAWRNIGR